MLSTLCVHLAILAVACLGSLYSRRRPSPFVVLALVYGLYRVLAVAGLLYVNGALLLLDLQSCRVSACHLALACMRQVCRQAQPAF